ncbi:hypothetical protein RY27_15510 [Litorilinea aerophila]|nr:hypothetical protein RY27_15510 [Litorilinea aerophila]
MAYASALGNVQAVEATGPLLQLLDTMANEGARLELALSLGRVVGEEHNFIRLGRQVRGDAGTAMAQAVASLKRRVEKRVNAGLPAALDACADLLARNNLAAGTRQLAQILERLPTDSLHPWSVAILAECRVHLAQDGADRMEYAILALHVLQVDWLQ